MSDKSISTLQTVANAGLNDRITGLHEKAIGQAQREQILVEQNALNQIANNNRAQEANQARQDVQFWMESANIAKNKVKKLEAELESYKDLLSRPMSEIASKNDNFKETYHRQQELLADWMVSQRGFKELAIEFGIALGKTKEEAISAGLKNKESVFGNSTRHGNNLDSLGDYRAAAERLNQKNRPSR